MNDIRSQLMEFPEIAKLIGVPQPERWHPEGDVFEHTVLVVEQAHKRYRYKPYIQMCAIVHDIGKAYTDPEKWPSHHGHANLGIRPAKQFLERLNISLEIIEVCLLTTKYHMHIHDAQVLRASRYEKIVREFMETIGINRTNTGLITLARLGVCDHYGRGGADFTETYLNPAIFLACARLTFDAIKQNKKINYKDLATSMKQIQMQTENGKMLLESAINDLELNK